MFNKLKAFWQKFWQTLKDAYTNAKKDPVTDNVQEWRDITRINLLDIFVKKLNNLCNTEATFDVVSDSTRSERLKTLAKDVESKRYKITSYMLADGDFWVFPAVNRHGEVIHTYLTQEQVRIIEIEHENITEVQGVIDWATDNHNKVYFLNRNHRLEDDGTLYIEYSVTNDLYEKAYYEPWSELDGRVYSFTNANHIGVGRYKSPTDSRGLSPVYGVPLNFGCRQVEDKIFADLVQIDKEFKNGESKIFADPTILRKGREKHGEESWNIPEYVFPINKRAGETGSAIDIFNPALRFSEHYSKLVADFALYEKQIGTSKGILTDNETTETATATAVKRANADTLALLGNIRQAIDNGNEMTLQADAVFLNVPFDLWTYTSDWYDPFEDPAEQWKRLVEAKDAGVAENIDLARWLFPNLSQEELNEKLARIQEQGQIDTDSALEKILGGN